MLQVENLSYKYGQRKVLTDVNITFEKGKMYAIVGESGSGKTTLLSLLAGIDSAPIGSITYNDTLLAPMTLTKYRKNVSIVFQSYNLIYYMTPLQNVMTALDIVKPTKNRKLIATEYLTKVGIPQDAMHRKCGKLSGGQQQRVAIARALACDSDIIFADEPTGNLDSKTSKGIIILLKSLAAEDGKCVVCVTHDKKIAQYANTIIKIVDGKVKESKK